MALAAFFGFEPCADKRIGCVKERRTKVDYADFMKMLVHYYPDAEPIHLVQDNLNTHTSGSFCEALSAAEAFELAKRFELHYNPKKGSWLNVVEVDSYKHTKSSRKFIYHL